MRTSTRRALLLCVLAACGHGHASAVPHHAGGARGVALEGTRIALDASSSLVLLDESSAAKLIGAKDPFVDAMSPLDRRLRVGKSEAVGTDELLAHARAQVRTFRPEHIERIRAAALVLARALERERLWLDLPSDIPVVLTTGLEEAGADTGVAYTRSGAIYLNERALDEVPTYLLAHELFHVYSQSHPAEREVLYRRIGFARLPGPLAWPETVEARRVTSPEEPRAMHGITVRYQGAEVLAVYVALANEAGDAKGPLLTRASTFYALLDPSRPTVVRDDVTLANYFEFENFFEQVGRNTGYLAGPEEILADNFEMLLDAPDRARTPEILDALRKTMSPAQAVGAQAEAGRSERASAQ